MKIVYVMCFCIALLSQNLAGMLLEEKEVLQAETLSSGSQALRDLALRYAAFMQKDEQTQQMLATFVKQRREFDALRLVKSRDRDDDDIEAKEEARDTEVRIEQLNSTEDEITGEQDLDMMRRLQRVIYGKEVIMRDEFRMIAQAKGVLVARHDGKIIGYLLSVNPKTGREIAAKDSKVAAIFDHFDKHVPVGCSYRYLMQICIDPKYQNKDIVAKLYTKFLMPCAQSVTGVLFTTFHKDNEYACDFLIQSFFGFPGFRKIDCCPALGDSYVVAQYKSSIDC